MPSKKDTLLSQLIEFYFKGRIRLAQNRDILQLVDKLPKPQIDLTGDLKQTYYEELKGKYGFYQ